MTGQDMANTLLVGVSEADITNYCRENPAPYAVPKFVEFRDELPMTVTEKLFKRQLRDEVIARMKESQNAT